MPKDRKERSASFDGHRPSPYGCSSSCMRHSSCLAHRESEETFKEWDEARCPICMEHPHNAVLIICSSYEKGCRMYMCDTSHRHSNCLDLFCKSFTETASSASHPEERSLVVVNSEESRDASCQVGDAAKLVCPLCRGQIIKWIVVEPARRFMNAKLRSCAREVCNFSGSYQDLRKHAKLEHPFVRPAEADPERQRDWRRLQYQRDLGDVLSSLHSSLGEGMEDCILPIDESGWPTVFFLIRVFQPRYNPRGSWYARPPVRGSMESGFMRPSTQLWGETSEPMLEHSSLEDQRYHPDGGLERWGWRQGSG